MNIFVSSLSFKCKKEDLENLFAPYCTVYNARIITNKTTHRSKGYGFVEIDDEELTEEEKAEYAESGYDDYEIPEYILSCKMPKDGQDILIATSWGVSQDLCMADCDEVGNNMYSLEDHGDWDGVKAWADMPKYKGGGGDA